MPPASQYFGTFLCFLALFVGSDFLFTSNKHPRAWLKRSIIWLFAALFFTLAIRAVNG